MTSLAEIKAAVARAQEDDADFIELDIEAVPWLVVRVEELAEALRVVSNAYGCFVGCTGVLPGAPENGHTVACRQARAALTCLEGS